MTYPLTNLKKIGANLESSLEFPNSTENFAFDTCVIDKINLCNSISALTLTNPNKIS